MAWNRIPGSNAKYTPEREQRRTQQDSGQGSGDPDHSLSNTQVGREIMWDREPLRKGPVTRGSGLREWFIEPRTNRCHYQTYRHPEYNRDTSTRAAFQARVYLCSQQLLVAAECLASPQSLTPSRAKRRAPSTMVPNETLHLGHRPTRSDERSDLAKSDQRPEGHGGAGLPQKGRRGPRASPRE